MKYTIVFFSSDGYPCYFKKERAGLSLLNIARKVLKNHFPKFYFNHQIPEFKCNPILIFSKELAKLSGLFYDSNSILYEVPANSLNDFCSLDFNFLYDPITKNISNVNYFRHFNRDKLLEYFIQNDFSTHF
jgi:hypothetical protein